jgi:XTP/dITP diphosphohydrolase
MMDILDGCGAEFADLTAWPDAPDVDEDGETFEANARKKATELARAVGQWVLAEDSGLVVPALGGRPGVYSARFGGSHGDDDANNQLLLSELGNRTYDRRHGFYVCVAALADATGAVHAVVEGRCHGIIADRLRGSNGFGYDPLFLIPEYHRTFGELSARVKRALSHRARALAHLRPILRQLAR